MSDAAHKSFDATPARKQKARRDGNVARSSEVSGTAAFAGAALLTFAVLPMLGALAADALRDLCAHPQADRWPSSLAAIVGLALLPIGAAAIAASALSLAQGGGLRVTGLKCDLARLNPVAGLKRMFGAEALVAALRALVAFTAVALALVPLLADAFVRATTVREIGAFGSLALAGAQRACWSAAAVGAVFAAADYVIARRRWLRGLKMSLAELRRDQKENDGDPAARSRRKALHRTLIRGSIGRTKDASFVVVNPTHIAIAIRYAPPAVAVPEILVRATDDGAYRVRDLARRHAIPIVENVALARALFAQGEAGHAIPAPTFVAVARVIAALLAQGVSL